MLEFSELSTTRLRLTPIDFPDAAALAQLMQDPEIPANGLGITYPYSIEDAEQMITNAKKAADNNQYRWTIRLRNTQAVIGLGSIVINATHRHGEIGYWIGKAFWNQGYATEAAGALLHFAFKTVTLHRVIAQTFSHNPASTRVIEKLGLQFEGTLREHLWHEFSGEFKTLFVYSILEDEFNNQN